MAMYIVVKDGVVEVRQNHGSVVATMALEEACERLRIDPATNASLVMTLQAEIRRLQANASTASVAVPVATLVVVEDASNFRQRAFEHDPMYLDHLGQLNPEVLLDICQFISQERIINAIQRMRHIRNWSIQESKDFAHQLDALLCQGFSPYGISLSRLKDLRTIRNGNSDGWNVVREEIESVSGQRTSIVDMFINYIDSWIEMLEEFD